MEEAFAGDLEATVDRAVLVLPYKPRSSAGGWENECRNWLERFTPLCYDALMGQQIGVIIGEGFQGELEVGWLEQVARQTLSAEGIIAPVELGLVIANEEEVRHLNQSYRGVDKPTDVLSFGFLSRQSGGEEGSLFFVNPPDGLLHLGEVIVSYPQAMRQAEEERHPLRREVALLIVHGVLHLLGYDHENPGQESRMRAREKEILGQIGV